MSAINLTFNCYPHLHQSGIIRDSGSLTRGLPITIEDNVLISYGVIVLGGTTCRSGMVAAAGAVLRGEYASCQIYAGIPAKKIADRFETSQQYDSWRKINWKNTSVFELINSESKHVEAINTNKKDRWVVFRGYKGKNGMLIPKDMIGYEVDGETIPISKAPKELTDYFRQGLISDDSDISWVECPFSHFRF